MHDYFSSVVCARMLMQQRVAIDDHCALPLATSVSTGVVGSSILYHYPSRHAHLRPPRVHHYQGPPFSLALAFALATDEVTLDHWSLSLPKPAPPDAATDGMIDRCAIDAESLRLYKV